MLIPSRPMAHLVCTLACTSTLFAQALTTALETMSLPSTRLEGLLHEPVVQRDRGQIQAGSGAWKAYFASDGVAFRVALGAEAIDPLETRFSFVDVRRGETTLVTCDESLAGEPTFTDRTVSYEHRPDVHETFEATPEGLEHSFTFFEPPRGAGDLIARIRIDSPLSLREGPGCDGLVLGDGSEDVLKIGAVVGIDAAGHRQMGELRFEGQYLEYVLPSDFVESASYPLVLDPLIGPRRSFDRGPGDDTGADIAYDLSNDVYLVVWEYAFTGADSDIWGQRLRLDGTLVGSPIGIDLGPADTHGANVANVRLRSAFFVAEEDSNSNGYEIWGRAIAASSGALGNWRRVQASSPGVTEGAQPEVCGDQTMQDDDCIVTYFDPVTDRIYIAEVEIAPNLDSTVIYSANIGPGVRPRICKSGGEARRACVTWELASYGIVVRAIDMDANLLSDNGAIPGPTSVGRPAIDGDGTHFLLAYQRRDVGRSDFDVWTIDIRISAQPSPTAPLSSTRQASFESTPTRDEYRPAVSCLGNVPNTPNFAVSWVDGTAGNTFAMRTESNGIGCGVPIGIETGPNRSEVPAMASTYSGGASGAGSAVVAFQILAGDWTVFTQGWNPYGGRIIDRRGGCGQGGTLTVNGPVALGNGAHSVELSGANQGSPAQSSVLLIQGGSTSPTLTPFCACQLLLQAQVFFGVAVTWGGRVVVPLPIGCDPNFVGANVSYQFWTLTLQSSPCASQPISFSNIVETVLGV